LSINFRTWIGEVTTGHGVMILGPTLLAAFSGTMSWPTAVPFLVAGVVGLAWPENTVLRSVAQAGALDVEDLITAYRTGVSHGGSGGSTAVAAATSVPRSPRATAMSALAVLVAAGLALTACANQTPAQTAATEATIASGLLCLADATGKVIATVNTSDTNAVNGVNTAIAAGSVLLTDSACRSALASSALAVPAASVSAVGVPAVGVASP
jgi:hypothetical protein